MDDIPSVLVATGYEGPSPHLTIATVDRKGKNPVEQEQPTGKVWSVMTERIVDDGSHTGVWKGFVKLDSGLTKVFLALKPPPGILPGAKISIVGNLDEYSEDIRFEGDCWVQPIDRLKHFSSKCWFSMACSEIGGERDPVAYAAIYGVRLECCRLEAKKRGQEIPVPILQTEFGTVPTARQMDFLRMFVGDANVGTVKPTLNPDWYFPDGTLRYHPSKDETKRIISKGIQKSRLKSIPWTGFVTDDGIDIQIELLDRPHKRYDPKPKKAVLTARKEYILSSDGHICRMALKILHHDDSIEHLLLGPAWPKGWEFVVDAVMKRNKPDVLVVEGTEGATDFYDMVMYEAAIQVSDSLATKRNVTPSVRA